MTSVTLSGGVSETSMALLLFIVSWCSEARNSPFVCSDKLLNSKVNRPQTRRPIRHKCHLQDNCIRDISKKSTSPQSHRALRARPSLAADPHLPRTLLLKTRLLTRLLTHKAVATLKLGTGIQWREILGRHLT